ncbi:MAG: helix-turn-helix transcriptional regulator [Christensenellaceae bacterium]|jgi:PadR family transcriptional regulator PadR|nr:helix-turn-helix transcriptional regulator [Christensenellaceae bacterium]
MAEETKANRGTIIQIVLNSLLDGDKYGYEICKDIEQKSGGKLVLKQPSLYSSLRRMSEKGVISSYWDESDQGGRRHYYSITEGGREQYERNKSNWANYNALVSSLNTEELKALSAEPQKTQEEQKSDSIKVVKQENLFAFTKPIPKVDAEESAPASFVQYDLFNVASKFVASDAAEIKTETNLYQNKFSDSADPKSTIQPLSPIFKSYESVNTRDLENLQKNYNSYANSEDTEDVDISGLSLSDFGLDDTPANDEPEQDAELKEITHHEVKEIEFHEHMEPEAQEKDPYAPGDLSKFSEVLSDEQRVETGFSEQYSSRYEYNPATYTVKPKERVRSEEPDIDYKNILGGLYAGGGRGDPYEKKRFDEQQYLKQYEGESENAVQPIPEEAPLPASETPQLVNISPQYDDYNVSANSFEMFKSDLAMDGIRVKKYVKHKNIIRTGDNFIKYSKLKLVQGWLLWLIMAAEIVAAYFIMKSVNLLPAAQENLYFIAIGVIFAYPLFYSLAYMINPDRKIASTFRVNISLFNRLLAVMITVVFVFSISLFMGMTALNQLDFLNYWLLPIILSTNYIVAGLLYYILLRSKRYNV